jgi:uncharacterized membrane protein YkoI
VRQNFAARAFAARVLPHAAGGGADEAPGRWIGWGSLLSVEEDAMLRRIALSAATAAALLSTTPIAIAANQAAAAAPAESPAGHQSGAELAAFQRAKLPIAGAISAGKQHAGGGKAIDASFEAKADAPAYRVKVYYNNLVWEGLVDANTGKLIGRATTTPENRLDQEDRAELAALHQAKTTLAEAVKAAERHTGGQAIDPGLEQRSGTVAYEIQIVKDGAVHRLKVDPATAQASAG